MIEVMPGLYVVSVWLHILAAIAWIGGMFFLVIVVVPWLRRGGADVAVVFLRATSGRLRGMGWICFAVLVVTGVFNLHARGVALGDFASADWRASGFGKAVLAKLTLFAGVLLVSLVHDFVVGPQAMRELERDATSPTARILRRRASRLGRLNAALALALVGAGVVLVRGWPW